MSGSFLGFSTIELPVGDGSTVLAHGGRMNHATVVSGEDLFVLGAPLLSTYIDTTTGTESATLLYKTVLTFQERVSGSEDQQRWVYYSSNFPNASDGTVRANTWVKELDQIPGFDGGSYVTTDPTAHPDLDAGTPGLMFEGISGRADASADYPAQKWSRRTYWWWSFDPAPDPSASCTTTVHASLTLSTTENMTSVGVWLNPGPDNAAGMYAAGAGDAWTYNGYDTRSPNSSTPSVSDGASLDLQFSLVSGTAGYYWTGTLAWNSVILDSTLLAHYGPDTINLQVNRLVSGGGLNRSALLALPDYGSSTSEFAAVDALVLDSSRVAYLIRTFSQFPGLAVVIHNTVSGSLTKTNVFSYSNPNNYPAPYVPPQGYTCDTGRQVQIGSNTDGIGALAVDDTGALVVLVNAWETLLDGSDSSTTSYVASRSFTIDSSNVAHPAGNWAKYDQRVMSDSNHRPQLVGAVTITGVAYALIYDSRVGAHNYMLSTPAMSIFALQTPNPRHYSRLGVYNGTVHVMAEDWTTNDLLEVVEVRTNGASTTAMNTMAADSSVGFSWYGDERPWSTRAITPWGELVYAGDRWDGSQRVLTYGQVAIDGSVAPNIQGTAGLLGPNYELSDNMLVTASGKGVSVGRFTDRYSLLVYTVQFSPMGGGITPVLRMSQRDDGLGNARHPRLATSPGGSPSSRQSTYGARLPTSRYS